MGFAPDFQLTAKSQKAQENQYASDRNPLGATLTKAQGRLCSDQRVSEIKWVKNVMSKYSALDYQTHQAKQHKSPELDLETTGYVSEALYTCRLRPQTSTNPVGCSTQRLASSDYLRYNIR